jgi:G3E family GTPase
MATDTEDTRIPVTLLTGFLGAGKTTLLNHLIRDPDAGRIAVIMNELGDVGLDHDLIEESTEEIVLMQSGCICCSIRGDLLKSLGKLVARRQNGDLDFDRIVIETTGIADPGPILHSLVVDQIVAPNFRMDGVVTLADAATGPRTLQKQIEAVNQIAMSDLIILSKTDLVPASEVARFEAQIADINSSARRVRADHGRVQTGTLFGLSAMRPTVTSD